MRPPRLDSELLRAALLGYEIRRKKIDEKIGEIRKELERAKISAPVPKRHLSAGAGRRIAVASRKRWAPQVRRPKMAEEPAIDAAGMPGDDPTRPR